FAKEGLPKLPGRGRHPARAGRSFEAWSLIGHDYEAALFDGPGRATTRGTAVTRQWSGRLRKKSLGGPAPVNRII
ncbi:MAG TPA: hypothetical protein VKE72_06410, partial [Methylocella sp.]|nr:hypothetical protein [Methylocella sp.]